MSDQAKAPEMGDEEEAKKNNRKFDNDGCRKRLEAALAARAKAEKEIEIKNRAIDEAHRKLKAYEAEIAEYRKESGK